MKKEFKEAIEDSPIIAAIKDDEGLKKCLTSESRVIFILYGDICNIPDIVETVKSSGKIAMVHIDLIAGLSSKEIAVDFIQKYTRADGIITTKPALIKRAKELGLYTILRLFVIDSMAYSNIEHQLRTAKPDLIVTEPTRNTPVEQLAKIAPTVSIDHLDGGAPEIYRKLAQLTGTQARLAILERRYREEIDRLKHTVDTQHITVSVIQANQGKINALHTYHSLGRVLRDAGFSFPKLIDSIPPGGRIDVSAERLPEMDADFVFATWRGDTGGKPQDEIAAMDAVLPGWCEFLTACQRGHYVLISREEAISNSFASLSLMVAQVQSHIAGRHLPEGK